MLAKMNHSDESVLLFVTWVGVLIGFVFDHLKGISSMMAIVATIPIIYERYAPIVNKVIKKIKRK